MFSDRCHTRETQRERQARVSDTQGAAYLREQTRIRREHVNTKKMEIGKCTNCAEIVDPTLPEYFHFDHIEQKTKVNNIATLCSDRRPIAEIDAELTKCQLLCIYCHHKKTAKERQDNPGWQTPGSVYSARKRKRPLNE